MTNELAAVRSRTLTDLVPRGAKVLWVASTGGHLAELHALASQSRSSSESVWLTFDTAQSRDLLRGQETHFVSYVGPRDGRGTLRTGKQVPGLLQRNDFDLCISTGAAIATSVLPLVATTGVPTAYVESLARTKSPSLSGRIVSLMPFVRTYSQYPGWRSSRWRYIGTLLSSWIADPVGSTNDRPLRIFVTLGTMRRYRFDRAVDAVLKVLRPGDEVRWQVGSTERQGLPGEVRDEMGYGELAEAIEWADVVLCHGGVGTILDCLRRGRSPVMLPRSVAFGEHVDDHQAEFVQHISARDLGVAFDMGQPQRQALLKAAATAIRAV